jgi:hypothetical protein
MRKLFALSAAVTMCVSLGWSGSLNPPAAPQSTPGPETRTPISATTTPGNEVASYRITQRGSYHLTSNLVLNPLFPSRHGIVIEANDVTIDLNGFILDGHQPILPFSEGQAQGEVTQTVGILASGSIENVTILNGTVRDWDFQGIGLLNTTRSRIHNVRVLNSGNAGIVGGLRCVITDCVSEGNGNDGIRLRGESRVENCEVTDNAFVGIAVNGGGSRVVRNSVLGNQGDGIQVLLLGDRSLIAENLVTGGSSNGIYVLGSVAGAVVRDNVVGGNQGIGIVESGTPPNGSLFYGNISSGNGTDYSNVPLVVTSPTESTGPFANISE